MDLINVFLFGEDLNPSSLRKIDKAKYSEMFRREASFINIVPIY